MGRKDEIGSVLSFWLEEVGRDGWYKVDEAVDTTIKRRFGGLVEAATSGELDEWACDPQGSLALLILLDQFTRNVHRGKAAAFAADEAALAHAKQAIQRGFDMKVPEPQRQFFYLPLMHSESLTDQERCIRLIMERLPETGDDNMEHAVKHRDVIRRFGRFPSRNAALGREDTEKEIEYREGGGYMG